MIKKYCKYCGREFYTDYYEGGYIDHVINFSENSFLHRSENTIDYYVKEITRHGNDLRLLQDIKERLNCFMKWSDISDNTKHQVESECLTIIEEIVTAENKINTFLNTLSPMERNILRQRQI